MYFNKDLYEFFNEARPSGTRTVNKDVEDIRAGRYIFKGDSPEDADADKGETRGRTPERSKAPEKAKTDKLPLDKQSVKSSFEPGKVHEIYFKNIFPGQPRKYFRLFRKISEQDYKKIYNSNKYNLTNPKIIPSDKEEHFEDIYYLKPDMGIPIEKDGFFSLTKKELNDIKSKYPEYTKNLTLVSIEDISNGVNLRYYDIESLIQRWDIKKAYSSKRKEKSDTEKEKAVDKSKLAGSFLVDNSDTFDKILYLYNKANQPGIKGDDAKEYKDLAKGFIKKYVDRLKQNDKEVISRVLGILQEKLKDKLPLYRMIVGEYEDTSKTTVEPTTSSSDKEKKQKDSTDKKPSQNKISSIEDKGKEFMTDQKHVVTLNKLINAFSESEDKEKNDKEEREYQRNQIFTYLPELLKQVNSFSKSKEVKDYIVKDMIRNRIAALTGDDNTELYQMISKTYDKMKAQKETINEGVEIKDDEMYSVSVKYDGGRYTDVRMPGKSLKKLVGSQDLEFNKELPFERSVYDPQKEKKENVKGILKINTSSVSKGPLKLIGRRTPEGDPIYRDPSTKSAEKEKEKVPTKTFTTSVSGQGARSYKAPVNMGIKIVDAKPSDLAYKYYVIDIEGKQIAHGANDWKDAKEKADQLGDKFKAVQRAALPALGVKIYEAISQADKDQLKNYRVSFTIQSDVDPDKQFNISDNVKDYKDEKTKFTINLVQAGTLTFDKFGTAVFKYSKDNKEYQALNIPDALSKIVKKSFEAQDPQSSTDSKLESYIRKRIKQAIKEAEVSQYWGYQGKDVKKKRLEEYLKRYDWGFQDSDNPYTHAEGSAKHAIVSKLVHELAAMGVDSIAIFNSYAPDGYQVSDLDQLDYASDSPLGSQLTQPYNPDSLTARGGRVAEEDGKVTSIAQQYLDKVNAKYKTIEDLAKGYNAKDRDIMGSESVKKVIQKAIAQSYGKDAAKAGPELKKAFMTISAEDLDKNG